MNKSSSKKIVSDRNFATYLIPSELSRFRGDITQLATYLDEWSKKRGGQALMADLAQVIKGMDQAIITCQTILTAPAKPPKPGK